MLRRAARPLVRVMSMQVLAWLAGQIIAKRLSRGDDTTDEFTVAAIMGGAKFRSHAQQLRSGRAIAAMGGIDLDLRDATLDPDGATLVVSATMGGVQVTVPEDWAVEVDTSAVLGGVQTNVTAVDDLPGDAPRLRVRAVARMGGALVTVPQS